MSRKRAIHMPDHPDASPLGFVWVDVEQLGEFYARYGDPRQRTAEARHAPILTDRYMEGTRALDGTDIGSRVKRRTYMKMKNLADADDFKGEWKKAAAERTKVLVHRELPQREMRELRETVGRTAYELHHRRNR